MSLILTGNTSNITIDSTSGITFPNSTLQASAGVVLQVVNLATTTGFSSSSNVLSDTAVTATITPKFATSKILVLVNMSSCGKETNSTYIRAALLRGSTILEYFENIGAFTSSTAFNYIGSLSTCYLDSPATTSPTTYKVQGSSGFNNAIVYFGGTAATINATHTMTLMEIAA